MIDILTYKLVDGIIYNGLTVSFTVNLEVISNNFTTLAPRYHKVATTSRLNVATTLPTGVSQTFISKELTTLIQPIVRRRANMTMLGWDVYVVNKKHA